MTPGAPYRWRDEAAIRAFVAEVGFGLLCVTAPDRQHVVHLPLVWRDEGHVGLHLHRANPIVRHLDGQEALIVVTGAHHYISPDWYGMPDKVPTWNYQSAELRGVMRRLDHEQTVAHLDALSNDQESRLLPKPLWTREKMSEGLFERVMTGLIGFEMAVHAMEGTMKLGQDKPESARIAVADALAARGDAAMSALMRATRP
ncbi:MULTISPECIES: FMN-binding negative transcriptional regulator [Sphingobium]|uniref:Negative transcriptional regulator n=1 Tax=Sphingobium fuliginis (strain ATCC 27551) TaxID=336203 RepID=A0A292ZG70_SPHSA|nr:MULTISPECIES: FMN-binding negative transcriptional regulator [Sphingobium]PNQ01927.1 hypothetical protein A8G00_15545 [Sphingobium sp. SA916]GAY21916.1 negative transcriptional regulator [Sphingobium fuliginis]